jgi:peptide/nickel transport system substrate-binding protein
MRLGGAASVLALGLASASALSPAGAASTPSGSYGTLPAAHGTPTKGGTVSIAEDPGAGPTYIFPITPA